MSFDLSVDADNPAGPSPAGRDAPVDPTTAFGELAAIRLAGSTVNEVLLRVAELAKGAIPGAAAVSVTVLEDGGPGTAAFTDDVAMTLDETQYEANYGPCLDAARAGGVNLISDMAGDDRWPQFAERALAADVRGSLSVGMDVGAAHSGALNIYAAGADAFDDDAVELGTTFARYAGVTLANAHLYQATAVLAEQMQTAMASRAVIEQAKGILIAQQSVTPDQAFRLLSKASQTGNRKLRDIAQAVVDGAANDPRPPNPF